MQLCLLWPNLKRIVSSNHHAGESLSSILSMFRCEMRDKDGILGSCMQTVDRSPHSHCDSLIHFVNPLAFRPDGF